MLSKFGTDVFLHHIRNNFETCLNPRRKSSSNGVEKVAQFNFERASMHHESHNKIGMPHPQCTLRVLCVRRSIGVVD